MPATTEQLKARWQTEDGRRRLAQVIELARRGKDWAPVLKGFPFRDEAENGLDVIPQKTHHMLIGAHAVMDLLSSIGLYVQALTTSAEHAGQDEGVP